MESFVFYSLAGLGLIIISAMALFRYGLVGMAVILPSLAAAAYMSAGAIDITNLLVPAILGGTGGYCLKIKGSLQFYVVITSVLLTATLAGNFYYITKVKGIDLVEQSRTEIVKLFNDGKMPKDKQQEYLEKFDATKGWYRNLVVFAYYLSSLFFSMIGYLVYKRFSIRYMEKKVIKGLEFFRLSDYTIFGLLSAWGSVLLLKQSQNEFIFLAGLNLALILTMLYFVQALGVVKHILMKRGLPGYILPLSFILVFIIAPPALFFLVVVLSGIGTLDIWADFRKLNIDNSTTT